MCSLKIISHSERETINLGARIAHLLCPGDIVCLFGELGAGKTILVKGMAVGLGISRDKVRSPSFVLIREYSPDRKNKTKVALYHLDLFRLRNLKDILDLGYEEYLYARGICVIEWAERMKEILPKEFLKIAIDIKGQTKRVIKLIGKGERYRFLLQDKLRIFKK